MARRAGRQRAWRPVASLPGQTSGAASGTRRWAPARAPPRGRRLRMAIRRVTTWPMADDVADGRWPMADVVAKG
eukprot:3298884-Prymnesium_polylepis.1